MSIKKEQYFLVDVTKIIFALVIVLHHIARTINMNPSFQEVLEIVTSIGITYFFIASGFFLYKKIKEEPENKNIILLKQFKRIGIIYLFWTITFIPFRIPAIIKIGLNWKGQVIYWLKYLRVFLLIGEDQLWFLLAILQVLILFFIFMRKDKLKWCIFIAIIAFVFAMMINHFTNIINANDITKKIYDLYIKIFASIRNGLFTGLPFMVVGCLVAKYKNFLEKQKKYYLVFGVISTIGLIMAIITENGFVTGQIVILVSLFLFLFEICFKVKESSTYVRNMSILIYVSHVQILYLFKSILGTNNNLVMLATVIIVDIVLSLSIIIASKKMKVLKYLY